VIFSLASVQVQSGGVAILRWFLACLQASSTVLLTLLLPLRRRKIHRLIQWAGNLRRSIIRPLSPGETGPSKGPQDTLSAPQRPPTRGSSNLTRNLNEGPLSPPAGWPQGVLFYMSENIESDRHSYNNFYGLAA